MWWYQPYNILLRIIFPVLYPYTNNSSIYNITSDTDFWNLWWHYLRRVAPEYRHISKLKFQFSSNLSAIPIRIEPPFPFTLLRIKSSEQQSPYQSASKSAIYVPLSYRKNILPIDPINLDYPKDLCLYNIIINDGGNTLYTT